ncbi:hypothetical protein SAMN04487764_2764 [Gillisia sp. Hel1_33_143]|uniref:hypothetical protein n=1 Tax=Gillisia sp. Hel1_33_143 TaxID=1336796 RepID=UPI00087BB88D|nr:hypothetical protein [Gillisia sp. Hel1_33_143]SDS67069.1 hypothetical protein SAMN04487764_2764 [Gillisia sp. Hel1_33_143]
MTEFLSNAKNSSRNPLGIIALFISLIYGFACLVLGTSGEKLSSYEKIPIVYFLIVFPILILISFLFLVTKHHNKLYAPKDYKDERNFFKGFENQQTNIRNNEGQEEIISTDSHINSLMKWGSIKGMYALYAVYLSKLHNVKFTLQDLEANSSLLTEEYTHGFLVAASSMGAFKFTSHDQPFLIDEINEKLENNIKDLVYKQAEKQREEENSDYLYNQLNLLEKAFEKASKNK